MNTTNLLGPHSPETQKVLNGAWAASELAAPETAGPVSSLGVVGGSLPVSLAAQIISAHTRYERATTWDEQAAKYEEWESSRKELDTLIGQLACWIQRQPEENTASEPTRPPT